MNLELHAQGMPSYEDVERFVKCRAELALAPLRDRVDAVNVFVERREDADRDESVRCLVVAKSATRADVVVERLHRNLYVAIHLALDEAGWALADSCAREQDDLLERQLEVLCGGAAKAGGAAAFAANQAA